MKKYHQKRILKRLLLLFLVSLLCIIIISTITIPQHTKYSEHYVNIHGIYLLDPIKVDHFQLTNHQGNVVSEVDFKDHWNFILFGFTNCNSVCPITLSVLSKMYQLLQNKLPPKELPNIFFVSIDPEEDSLIKLKNYVTFFNPNFIGIKGSSDETIKLEKFFHVVVKKTSDIKTMKTTFDHSAEIILVNPEGNIQAYFTFPPQTEQLFNDYFSILNKWLHVHKKQ